jgi:hypothetical protein
MFITKEMSLTVLPKSFSPFSLFSPVFNFKRGCCALVRGGRVCNSISVNDIYYKGYKSLERQFLTVANATLVLSKFHLFI